MSFERIKFQSIGITVVYDDEVHGEMTGMFFPFEDAEKLDGVICEIRSTHWTKWDFIRAWWTARRLNKLMGIK